MAAQVVLVQEEPRGPSQLIEVPVNANGLQRVNFPDQQQLRNLPDQKVIIKGMRLITVDALTNGVISGTVNAPVTELQKMTLVIYAEGWEKGQYIPILSLCDMSFPGSTAMHTYHMTRFNEWQNVDWSKTYIQYANNTVSALTPYVVLLDVLYIKLYAEGVNKGQEIIGPS